MKEYKNKISIIVFIGILITGLGTWQTVEAGNSSIYVLPGQASKKIGDTFDISVKVSPEGQKVCVVEGKLILNKLSCQKVKMGSGISSQTSPSCQDLSFLLGIQGCAASDKTIFTVTVKAESSGSGTASFANVDVIGEGIPVSFVLSNGNYDITSSSLSCNCGNWSSWQNGDCGEGNCPLTQQLQTRTRTCAPSGCAVENESQCVDSSNCKTAPASTDADDGNGGEKEDNLSDEEGKQKSLSGEKVSEETEQKKRIFLAAINDFFSLENLLWILLIIIAIIIIIFLFSKRKKQS